MAVRKFGPTRAAGVRIEEQDGDKSITPGALGWAGFVGITEKGPVNKMVLCSTSSDFTKWFGGIIPESLLPDCADDYFTLANGAGGLAVCRVTDGNELQASYTVYNRRLGNLLGPVGTIKALNGGRWGGAEKRHAGTVLAVASITATTLQIEAAQATNYKQDELKGGYITLVQVANKQYLITGNTAAGLVTVQSDANMIGDHGGGAGSLLYYIELDNNGKAISIQLGDGDEQPDTEFSLEVYLDGTLSKRWGNLSTDPAAARYWVNLINSDTDNSYISVTDLWTGAQVASVRPANYYAAIASVTALVLTATIHSLTINSPGGGNPTMTLGATNDNMLEQTITITMSSATAGTAVSDRFGALGAVTLGVAFVPSPAFKYVPGFTITAGASPLAATNTLIIRFRPFKPNKLIGGFVWPDKVNAKRNKFRIVANDHKTVTVAAGSDLTVDGAPGDEFMIQAPIEMTGGRNGIANIVDATYQTAWEPSTSPMNDTNGLNLGLVKFATPGINSTAVQKAGTAYAEAKNHQYRAEFPANIVTDNAALAYILDTLGRSDYQTVFFPSYADVPHPDPISSREGKRKTIPTTGMQLGREARFANDYAGYHKAQAGQDAILPRILAIPTLDKALNEELLNPAGINVIKKSKGNYVLWGDRTCNLDPTWKFKHQREQMSYYEHVLQENFDFIIFTINDSLSDRQAETALVSFFMPEYTKRALRGKDFKSACIIKVDAELNTDLVRSQGDKIASISLKLADVTERFIIRIGKQGIFEATA
jgi:hypothetical protein